MITINYSSTRPTASEYKHIGFQIFRGAQQFSPPPLDGTVSAFCFSLKACAAERSCTMASLLLLLFPLNHKRLEEELGLQLVCTIPNLQRICCASESFFYFCFPSRRRVTIKCMGVLSHRRLLKCIWSSHSPPTTVPDSLLFQPMPLPSAGCVTGAGGFAAYLPVCVCACLGLACVCAHVCLREQKREKRSVRCKNTLCKWCTYACACVSTCLQQQL